MLSAYKLGGGIGPEGKFTPGNWSPTKWGGVETGVTTGDAITSFLDSFKKPKPGTSYISSSFGSGPGMSVGAPDIIGGDLGPTPPNLWEALEEDPWTGYRANEPYRPSYYTP